MNRSSPRYGRNAVPVTCSNACRRLFTCALLAVFAILAALCVAPAIALDIVGPAGSVQFGATVKVLPNGNIVVLDPYAFSNAGAVYLYDPDGILISTVTGQQPNDYIGSAGILVLANGNFVIWSPQWHNGVAAYAGAVTWASAATGVSGVVSASNSLVGTAEWDGYGNSVTSLNNGNYVVGSPNWTNSELVSGYAAGAVTWCNGAGGTVGPISATNSAVGAQGGNYTGKVVTALANGNYVFGSPYAVSQLAGIYYQGAATWGNGNGGTVGAVSAVDSLVGTTALNIVGSLGVTALTNGNYVVGSKYWGDGALVGAATWGDGNGGTHGVVSAGNSLVGTTTGDDVGKTVIALSNGNYVVVSPQWDNIDPVNGNASDAGAVTWGNGNGGTVGAVSSSNSLVGTSSNDKVGYNGVTALCNGNYVVASPFWNNNGGSVGAATWGNGSLGAAGDVLGNASLFGVNPNDQVGYAITALSNGNYVVGSPNWSNAGAGSAGAATLCGGSSGCAGTPSAANSIVGVKANDRAGTKVTALSNGNYVVSSPYWKDDADHLVGAATWGDGNGSATVGPVTSGNSLLGTTGNDEVSYDGIAALDNGHYVVGSSYWHSSGISVGAATLNVGDRTIASIVSAANSLVGTTYQDSVGSRITATGNGSYVVFSTAWDDGTTANAGAVTLRRGTDRLGATVTTENSVKGAIANSGLSMVFAYDAAHDRLVVGRPAENLVTIFQADLLIRDGFE